MHDVSVDTFVELVKQRDVGGIQSALRRDHYDIDTPDTEGKTALHHAVHHSSIDRDYTVVRMLIDLGADVNLKENSFRAETPLHMALRLRQFDAARMLIEAPVFDVIQTDSRHSERMLPAVCHIDTVQPHGPDDTASDTNHRHHQSTSPLNNITGTRTTFQPTVELYDAFFVRHDATAELCRRRRPPDYSSLPVRHLSVVHHPSTSLGRLLTGLNVRLLTSLCLVDCPLEPEVLADDAFSGLELRTLVLSGTGIRRLPNALLRMSPVVLETLKIDRNRLGPELPADAIGRFVSLRTLICDAQRPRLRRLPRALIGKLSRLEVLSIADNRILTEDLDSIADSIPRLRVFVCCRNRLTRLPVGLERLNRLAVLDASHNRIEELPPEVVGPLVSQLSRCDLHNAALFRRPKYRSMRRCEHVALLTHLHLDRVLSSTIGPSEVTSQRSNHHEAAADTAAGVTLSDRDVTIAIVGESRAGKRTLMEALASAAALSTGSYVSQEGNTKTTPERQTGSGGRHRSSTSGTGGFSALEFDVRQSDGGTCHVTAMAVSGDELADEYVRQIHVDLVLLAFDLQHACSDHVMSSNNGTRLMPEFARKRRWIARLQMWLQALYELDPEVAVVLVGTHADLVPDCNIAGNPSEPNDGGLVDTWRRLTEALLDPARSQHLRRNADLHRRPMSNCLLCAAKYLAVRRTVNLSHHNTTIRGNGVNSSDDDNTALKTTMTSSHAAPIRTSRRGGPSPGGNPAPVVPVVPPPRSFGYVDLSIPADANGVATSRSTNGHVTGDGGTGSTRSVPSLRFPHVLGYYETEIAAFPAVATAPSNDGVKSTPTTSGKRSAVAMAFGEGLYAKITGAGLTSSSVYETLKPASKKPTTDNGVATIPGSHTSHVPDSICRLLAAILRLTEARGPARRRSSVVSGWSALGRRLSAISERRFPFLKVDEQLVSLMTSKIGPDDRRSRIDVETLPTALLYLHRSGRVVYFPGGNRGDDDDDVDLTSQLVCTSPTWFIRTARRTCQSIVGGIVSREGLHECLKRELERSNDSTSSDARSLRLSLNAAYNSSSSSYSAYSAAGGGVPDEIIRWFVEALIRLGTCFPVPRCSTRSDQTDNDSLLAFPSQLQTGAPNIDTWSDNPGIGERQVTCEFRIRSLRPGFFIDIIRRLSCSTVTTASGSSSSDTFFFRCRELRRMFRPSSVIAVFSFLADHVTFGVSVDVAGCDDCCMPSDAIVRTGCRTSGATIAGPSEIRVHVGLCPDLDVVRVQCRGATKGVCCAMRAVLDFLDLYLDDAPLDGPPVSPPYASPPAPRSTPRTIPLSTVEDVDASSVSGGSPLPSYRSSDDVNTVEVERDKEDDCEDGDGERIYFLLCPKCVILRLDHPERIRIHQRLLSRQFPVMPAHRKPICQRWHHLGSWYRAAVGDYRKYSYSVLTSSTTAHSASSSCTSGRNASPASRSTPPPLPDYEYPHLILLAPPGVNESVRDWYVYSHATFLDGHFDVHLLCENPAYWHFVDGSAYRASSFEPPQQRQHRGHATQAPSHISTSTAGSANDYASLVYASVSPKLHTASPPTRSVDGRSTTFPAHFAGLAIAVVRAVHCIQAGRTVAPIVDRLARTHGDLLSAFDESAEYDEGDDETSGAKQELAGEPIFRPSPLSRTRDRIAAMLAVVLSDLVGGNQPEHFQRVAFELPQECAGVEPSMIANSIVFRSTGKAGSRHELARLLKAHESPSGRRFGQLRAVYVGHEIRWVCDRHYEELGGPITSWPDGMTERRKAAVSSKR